MRTIKIDDDIVLTSWDIDLETCYWTNHLLNMNIKGNVQSLIVTSTLTSSASKIFFWDNFCNNFFISSVKMNLYENFWNFQMPAILRLGAFQLEIIWEVEYKIRISKQIPDILSFDRRSSSNISEVAMIQNF